MKTNLGYYNKLFNRLPHDVVTWRWGRLLTRHLYHGDEAWAHSPVSAVIANLYMEVFVEQAIKSTTQKPKTWKRYVNDTITILDRSYVDCLLQHLNSQQPTIRFAMETEKDNIIVFLDSSVTREPYRRLTTSVYRKSTYTNQYVAHVSHHPQ